MNSYLIRGKEVQGVCSNLWSREGNASEDGVSYCFLSLPYFPLTAARKGRNGAAS